MKTQAQVVGYVRVSTDEQKASGLGLESQIEKIKSYCGLYDLELVGILTDAASGKNTNRDGLQAALDMLKTGKASGLVVSKLDRLTRSVKDMGILLEKHFTKHSLYVVAEQIDTSTASGRMVINLLMSVAQWERETIGERTTDALAAKRARKEKTGGHHAPFGFDSVDGKLIENGQEQDVIRIMNQLREEGYSFQKIADRLNKDGYLTKTGKAWSWKITRKVITRKAA